MIDNGCSSRVLSQQIHVIRRVSDPFRMVWSASFYAQRDEHEWCYGTLQLAIILNATPPKIVKAVAHVRNEIWSRKLNFDVAVFSFS